MKKILFFFILLLIPFAVYAVDPDYDVKGYFAIHQINNDGSVTVREALVLSGDMNGYERIIKTSNQKLTSGDKINFEHDAIYNPSGIKDIKAAAYRVNKSELSSDIVNKTFDYSSQTGYAHKGDRNVYTVEESNGTYNIRNYYSCSSCTIAYYFEYTITDLAVIHQDVAEIYYQLFSYQDVTENMGVIDMVVKYPGEDPGALKWAHGNVYGEVEPIGNTGFRLHSDKFPDRSELDYRTTFDRTLITNDASLYHSEVEALPSIKEIEYKRAEEREKELARIRRFIKTVQIAALAYIIFLVVFIIYVAIKYDREHKVSFYAKYYREFIEDYDVEVIDYLMNKTITPNAMSASIMNLVYKKKISAEPLDEKKKEYKFTLLSEENLSNSEKKLVDFLFKKVGDGTTFDTKALKDYAKSTKTYDKFNSNYKSWENSVLSEAKNQKFYVDLTGIKLRSALVLFIGVVIWFISITQIDDFVWSHLLLIPIIITAIYVISFQKRTEKGQLHYKKWKAFKNFLNDFGTFELKELPEIILWERYLVYATIFGLADKVQKTMNVRIKEFENVEGYNTSMFGYYYGYSNFGHVVSQSVTRARSLATSTAASQSSGNYSGGGGGFSGGGGFGGGGGGGHGF